MKGCQKPKKRRKRRVVVRQSCGRSSCAYAWDLVLSRAERGRQRLFLAGMIDVLRADGRLCTVCLILLDSLSSGDLARRRELARAWLKAADLARRSARASSRLERSYLEE